jgi:molecular chaperone Hsp33
VPSSSCKAPELGHHYDVPVLETLGHSAAASTLIAQSLKFDGSIALQISGDGPLAMLVMQCTSALDLRRDSVAAATRRGTPVRPNPSKTFH